MNKLIIALSVACASACVFADVGATPSKVQTNDWFSASVVEATPTLTSCTVTSVTQPTYEGGKIVIDSEISSPVTFTSGDDLGQDMAMAVFKLDTAIVPADVRQDTILPDTAKVAFAASEVNDTTKGYFAWLGSEWVQLDGATPEEGSSYDLVVTFDNRTDVKKVQFKVGNTVLTSNNQEWLPYGTALLGRMSIDLVGSGNVTSLAGKQLIINTEIVIPTDCGPIEIQETDMAAFRNTATGDVDAFINSNASVAFPGEFATENVSVGAAYALGLVKKNDSSGKMEPVDGGELKATAVAESTAAGIKIGLNVSPRTDTGATISFKIVDTTDSDKEVATASDGSNIVIPRDKLGTGLKIFKVQAIVSPAVQGEDAK